MSNEQIYLIIKITAYVMMGVIAFFAYRAVKGILTKGEDAVESAIKGYDAKLKKTGEMGAQKLKLSRYGIMYRFGDYNMNPSRYNTLRLFTGLSITGLILFAGFLASGRFNILSFIGIPVGYLLFDVLMKAMNDTDNKKMEMDIYQTYATLKIQLASNIYINNALEYVYQISTSKRYKEALQELVLNLSDKTITMEESVEIFRNRFKSKDIDRLCNMLSIFMQYGISEAYLSDISKSLESLLEADAITQQETIGVKSMAVSILYFILLSILIFSQVIASFNGMNLFSGV